MKKRISPEQFIRVWQAASSVDEVVKKLKMSKNAVHTRICLYRQKGIKLKSQARGKVVRKPSMKVADRLKALRRLAVEASK